MNLNFSKSVCLRLCALFVLAVAGCVIPWIYIVDPQPLTLSIVAKSVVAVPLLIGLFIGIGILYANSIEKLLGMIREKKRRWQERWIEKNFRPKDSPSKKL